MERVSSLFSHLAAPAALRLGGNSWRGKKATARIQACSLLFRGSSKQVPPQKRRLLSILSCFACLTCQDCPSKPKFSRPGESHRRRGKFSLSRAVEKSRASHWLARISGTGTPEPQRELRLEGSRVNLALRISLLPNVQSLVNPRPKTHPPPNDITMAVAPITGVRHMRRNASRPEA